MPIRPHTLARRAALLLLGATLGCTPASPDTGATLRRAITQLDLSAHGTHRSTSLVELDGDPHTLEALVELDCDTSKTHDKNPSQEEPSACRHWRFYAITTGDAALLLGEVTARGEEDVQLELLHEREGAPATLLLIDYRRETPHALTARPLLRMTGGSLVPGEPRRATLDPGVNGITCLDIEGRGTDTCLLLSHHALLEADATHLTAPDTRPLLIDPFAARVTRWPPEDISKDDDFNPTPAASATLRGALEALTSRSDDVSRRARLLGLMRALDLRPEALDAHLEPVRRAYASLPQRALEHDPHVHQRLFHALAWSDLPAQARWADALRRHSQSMRGHGALTSLLLLALPPEERAAWGEQLLDALLARNRHGGHATAMHSWYRKPMRPRPLDEDERLISGGFALLVTLPTFSPAASLTRDLQARGDAFDAPGACWNLWRTETWWLIANMLMKTPLDTIPAQTRTCFIERGLSALIPQPPAPHLQVDETRALARLRDHLRLDTPDTLSRELALQLTNFGYERALSEEVAALFTRASPHWKSQERPPADARTFSPEELLLVLATPHLTPTELTRWTERLFPATISPARVPHYEKLCRAALNDPQDLSFALELLASAPLSSQLARHCLPILLGATDQQALPPETIAQLHERLPRWLDPDRPASHLAPLLHALSRFPVATHPAAHAALQRLLDAYPYKRSVIHRGVSSALSKTNKTN